MTLSNCVLNKEEINLIKLCYSVECVETFKFLKIQSFILLNEFHVIGKSKSIEYVILLCICTRSFNHIPHQKQKLMGK